MHEKLERLQQLFENLSNVQQDDVLNLLEMWVKQLQTKQESSLNRQAPDTPTGNSATADYHHPSLDQQWRSVNALREYVREYYQPTIELAYIAFHPDLDSISTAKSRAAVEKMFELEAAYELKAILETQPNSSIITKHAVEEFQKNKRNTSN